MTPPMIRMPNQDGKGWRFLGSQAGPARGRPRLVFEKGTGLDQLERSPLRQAAHVVVALDVGRASPPPDSTTSGYRVPWTEELHLAAGFPSLFDGQLLYAASKKTG